MTLADDILKGDLMAAGRLMRDMDTLTPESCEALKCLIWFSNFPFATTAFSIRLSVVSITFAVISTSLSIMETRPQTTNPAPSCLPTVPSSCS